jgi:hypothetical protein
MFIAARGRVGRPSHLIATAEVLLRADNFVSAVEAVVSAIHSRLEAACESAGAHSGDLRNPPVPREERSTTSVAAPLVRSFSVRARNG